MPEGFSSIADLKIVIDASTENLRGGLTLAQNLVQRFGSESSRGLAAFDQAVGKASTGIAAFKGKLGILLTVAEKSIEFLANLRGEITRFAAATGTTAEFDEILTAFDATVVAVGEGLSGAFGSASQAAMSFVGALGDAAAGTERQQSSTEKAIRYLADQAAPALKKLGASFSTLADVGTLSIQTVKNELEVLEAQFDSTGKAVQRTVLALNEAGRVQMVRRDATEAERVVLLERIAALRERLATMPEVDLSDVTFNLKSRDIEAAIAKLEEENEVLEVKRETLGMVNAEAEAYLKRQQLLAGVRDGFVSEEQLARLDRQLALLRASNKAIEDYKKAETDRKAQEARDKGFERTLQGAERQILTARQQADALTLTAEAAARLGLEERLLADARAAGVAIDDALLARIRALADGYGQAAERLAEMRELMTDFKDYTSVVTRELDGAFRAFTTGAELNVRNMVANMIAELARLTFVKGFLEPLSDGLTSGLSSLFGGIAGARALGGPVDRGLPYLVGEKGPELFVPSSSGQVVPNGQLGGGVQVVTHIDARGATADAVAGIRAALAERDAALPSRILSVVRDARERGLA